MSAPQGCLGDGSTAIGANQAPLMSRRGATSELIKYAAKAFLATKITFINEIADLADNVGADVQEVAARPIGLDKPHRIEFLHAGPASGTHLPKDTARCSQDRTWHTRRESDAVVGRGGARGSRQRKRAMARQGRRRAGGRAAAARRRRALESYLQER